jgi:hypothetical protein
VVSSGADSRAFDGLVGRVFEVDSAACICTDDLRNFLWTTELFWKSGVEIPVDLGAYPQGRRRPEDRPRARLGERSAESHRRPWSDCSACSVT